MGTDRGTSHSRTATGTAGDRTEVGSREEWLVARRELLAREKELTQRSDELAKERWVAKERWALPWVPVETECVF